MSILVGAQGDIEYQVPFMVHIHTVHITLPLMAKFKPATVKVGNSLYGMVRHLPILFSKLPGDPVMVS